MRECNPHAVRKLKGGGVKVSSRGSNTFALLDFYLYGYKIAD